MWSDEEKESRSHENGDWKAGRSGRIKPLRYIGSIEKKGNERWKEWGNESATCKQEHDENEEKIAPIHQLKTNRMLRENKFNYTKAMAVKNGEKFWRGLPDNERVLEKKECGILHMSKKPLKVLLERIPQEIEEDLEQNNYKIEKVKRTDKNCINWYLKVVQIHIS